MVSCRFNLFVIIIYFEIVIEKIGVSGSRIFIINVITKLILQSLSNLSHLQFENNLIKYKKQYLLLSLVI